MIDHERPGETRRDTVNRDDYERGKPGCVLAGDIEPYSDEDPSAGVYTERRVVNPQDPENYAVDKLVRVFGSVDRGTYYELHLAELSDDMHGAPPSFGVYKVTPEGIILAEDGSPDFEKGYFLSGESLEDYELGELVKQLLVPVSVRRPEHDQTPKRLEIALPLPKDYTDNPPRYQYP